jgi:tRNA G18 (ribose-2'-O)-methylase SpoU
LLENAVNVAGVARTCEIFSVQQLVVASAAVVKSEAFQGAAVSCDRWLDILSVCESELLGYLKGKQREGYTVVALEQSDAAVSLAGTEPLPRRCVLLLGRERDGVPVQLLQMVDMCVEIPQFGVTRSLNVHVSAALYIWEATRRNTAFVEAASGVHVPERKILI